MEHIRISLQYEPASMQDIVLLSSSEEIPEILETEQEPAPDIEQALVDFHLTEPVLESLSGILIWSKILVACTLLFMLLEISIMVVLTRSASLEILVVLAFLRSAISLGIDGWIVWQAFKFNQQMGQALNFNDNTALAEAFRHQKVYFQWVFLNIMVTVAYSLLKMLF